MSEPLQYIGDFLNEVAFIVQEHITELPSGYKKGSCNHNIPVDHEHAALANNISSSEKQQLKNEMLVYYYDNIGVS